MDVQVGYATAHGTTRGVADARACPAFVLGSAVHDQSWLEPAKAFARDNLDVLGRRPVWLFSVEMPGAPRGPWKWWRRGISR